jgi:hypothetical protein
LVCYSQNRAPAPQSSNATMRRSALQALIPRLNSASCRADRWRMSGRCQCAVPLVTHGQLRRSAQPRSRRPLAAIQLPRTRHAIRIHVTVVPAATTALSETRRKIAALEPRMAQARSVLGHCWTVRIAEDEPQRADDRRRRADRRLRSAATSPPTARKRNQEGDANSGAPGSQPRRPPTSLARRAAR